MAREDYPEAWLRQGDISGDGMIDGFDVTIMASNYRKAASVKPECDLDGDGWISILDIEKAVRNFGLTYERWVKAVNERMKRGAMIIGGVALIPAVVIGVGGK